MAKLKSSGSAHKLFGDLEISESSELEPLIRFTYRFRVYVYASFAEDLQRLTAAWTMTILQGRWIESGWWTGASGAHLSGGILEGEMNAYMQNIYQNICN